MNDGSMQRGALAWPKAFVEIVLALSSKAHSSCEWQAQMAQMADCPDGRWGGLSDLM